MATRKSLMALPAGLLLALLMTGTSADSPAAASAATKIHSVDWENTAVPGAVCDAPHKIRLHNGSATIITPPRPRGNHKSCCRPGGNGGIRRRTGES
jgi:hypothetical protein